MNFIFRLATFLAYICVEARIRISVRVRRDQGKGETRDIFFIFVRCAYFRINQTGGEEGGGGGWLSTCVRKLRKEICRSDVKNLVGIKMYTTRFNGINRKISKKCVRVISFYCFLSPSAKSRKRTQRESGVNVLTK